MIEVWKLINSNTELSQLPLLAGEVLLQCPWGIGSRTSCQHQNVWMLKPLTPIKQHAVCLAAQSCPTFCDSMDCSPPGSSVHWDSPGKNTGVGCHALLQGIFPTQGSNPGLLHWRCIPSLGPTEPPEKPKNTRVGSVSLLQGIFQTQESNWVLLHCRWMLYHLSYQGPIQDPTQLVIFKHTNAVILLRNCVKTFKERACEGLKHYNNE